VPRELARPIGSRAVATAGGACAALQFFSPACRFAFSPARRPTTTVPPELAGTRRAGGEPIDQAEERDRITPGGERYYPIFHTHFAVTSLFTLFFFSLRGVLFTL